MKWSGWPLTVLIATISVAISYVLFQMGIYFFFLPIIFFIPLARVFFRTRQRSHVICPTCGLASTGNYCPRCGARLYTDNSLDFVSILLFFTTLCQQFVKWNGLMCTCCRHKLVAYEFFLNFLLSGSLIGIFNDGVNHYYRYHIFRYKAL